jgi:hypothetical protein
MRGRNCFRAEMLLELTHMKGVMQNTPIWEQYPVRCVAHFGQHSKRAIIFGIEF